MNIEIFDPKVHIPENHWSYSDDSVSQEENMLKADKFFKLTGTSDESVEHVGLAISFGAYVIVIDGVWSSLNEYARVKSVNPNKILNFSYLNGRRDAFGNRGGFQSDAGNYDFKLQLEYC